MATKQLQITTIGGLISTHGGSILTGPFGTALKASEYSAIGSPVISVSEIGFGIITVHDKTPRVSPDVTARLSKYLLNTGDIVFARKGAGTAVERSAFVSDKEAGYFLGSDGIRLRLSPSANPRFVAYCLQSSAHRAWMIANSVGTTMPALNQGIIERIPLAIPARESQQQVCGVLGSLDDKLELNRRTNETLEAMARALFKSWFVDFDPVHAKAEVRRQHPSWGNAQVSRAALPKLAVDIAEPFPDRFEDSVLGPIPAGWKACNLPEAIKVNPSRTLAKGTVAPWLEMSNMPTSSARAISWEERAFGSGTKFTNGDTLVARITPCLENGKTAYVDFLQEGQVGAGSTEYIILQPKQPLPPTFGYFLARTETFRQHLIANMTGTSGRQRAPADCLNAFPVVVPPAEIAAHFGEFADKSLQTMKANDEESRNLAAARDALLPKLLSGELSVEKIGHSCEAKNGP